MPDAGGDQRRHLFIEGRARSQQFINPQQGGGQPFRTPDRHRPTHAERLTRQIDAVRQRGQGLEEERRAAGLSTDFGLIIEFASEPGFALKTDSLERRRSGIQLLNLRKKEVPSDASTQVELELATVRVPFGKLDLLQRLVDAYKTEDTSNGLPRHQPLVASIADIREAALEAFWTDKLPMPGRGVEAWWEAWLHAGTGADERPIVRRRFEEAAQGAGVFVEREEITLPENTVLLIRARREQLAGSLDLLNCLSELRMPQVPAEFFAAMGQVEQKSWVDDMIRRLRPASPAANAVCLLDSGVNHGHPMLESIVPSDGLQTLHAAWGTGDDPARPHGTMMAGLAAYGELTASLLTNTEIHLSHWVESVKMVHTGLPHDLHLYGNVTQESVARIEVAAPQRPRVFSMQVASEDTADRGKPTSWSAALDQICAGAGEEPSIRRLVMVSAGNVDITHSCEYPAKNETEQIHDPAQAWNSVTVGGWTDKAILTGGSLGDWRPLAPRGGLAPASSTSLTWESDWPLKPDVVMEAGNRIAQPATGQVDRHGDVELLTTNAQFRTRLLTTTGDTSAATVLAARFAALVHAEYPALWPETIRALLIHSAEWTPEMLGGRDLADLDKRAVNAVLRRFGFGVPRLQSALHSLRSSVTLICQDEIQPFVKSGSEVKTNELRFHDLPWPRETLQTLGGTVVKMKVTLSYFIEPNPGPRVPNNRYRYASCNLRFDVRRQTESQREFQARINQASRSETEDGSGTNPDSAEWTLGSRLRHRGSIHSDIWHGTAADLAEKNHVAVFPINGWWRGRPHLRRFESRMRYALIVSIRSPNVEVDLYTPIETQIRIPVVIPVS